MKPTRKLVLGALVLTGLVAVLGTARNARADYTAAVDAGTLRIVGDGATDTLVLFAGGGTLVGDVGADGTSDFTFDLASFDALEVAAGGGDDVIRLQGGGLADKAGTLDGEGGDDTIIGTIGDETLLGGRGDDSVAGGDGDDHADLGPGADTFTWNPGDDNDTVEGGGGNDTLAFNGANIGEQLAAAANGSRVRFTRDIASITMDLAGVERLAVRALGGADTITIGDLRGTDVEAADIDLSGSLGGGDAQPDSVVAEGTDAADDVSFASSGEAQSVEGLAARTSIVAGAEPADDLVARTGAGDDAVAMKVGVAGTATVNADGGEGADTATYDGTAGADEIAVVANGAETATVAAATARFDTLAVESLIVRGRAGDDTITGTGNLQPLTSLTFDGGADADVLRGGNGPDLLLGGKGDDSVDGNQGADTAFLGGGDDRFQWDPGDGSDVVEGEGGADALDFFGSNIGELMEASADGTRVRFTRNIGTIAMDLDGIERLAVRTFGGADTVTVGDLRGTGVNDVDVDLSASLGGGDGLTDSVIANGGDKKDRVRVTRSGAQVLVSGLASRLTIAGSESLNDTLRIQTFGGNDDVVVDPDAELAITPVIDLGADE
jgi:Ca2+-binding RTX toxin-like protein